MGNLSSGQPDPAKINGIALESPPGRITAQAYTEIKSTNANWVAVIPYAFSQKNSPEVRYNYDRQWWGERLDGAAELAKMAHDNNLKVMLKPQVWMHRTFTGDFEVQDSEGQAVWEKSYSAYILEFAEMADSMDIELFCVGTEYSKIAVQHPQFWRELISRVRRVYSGKLTYAANWDTYHKIAFWKELDFIGVNAYFPLVEAKIAEIDELKKAWEPIAEDLEKLSDTEQRPILFTEYGYRSADYATGKQWEISRNAQVNLQAQLNGYEAFYSVFWRENWVAGGFAWKWHFEKKIDTASNSAYTPQNKPAIKALRKAYAE